MGKGGTASVGQSSRSYRCVKGAHPCRQGFACPSWRRYRRQSRRPPPGRAPVPPARPCCLGTRRHRWRGSWRHGCRSAGSHRPRTGPTGPATGVFTVAPSDSKLWAAASQAASTSDPGRMRPRPALQAMRKAADAGPGRLAEHRRHPSGTRDRADRDRQSRTASWPPLERSSSSVRYGPGCPRHWVAIGQQRRSWASARSSRRSLRACGSTRRHRCPRASVPTPAASWAAAPIDEPAQP